MRTPPVAFNIQRLPNTANVGEKALLYDASGNPISSTSGALNVQIQGGSITQAGGPWTTNETQLGGTAIDVNSGNKSAGTQRVVLATDQPALTNALLTQDASDGATGSTTPSKAGLSGVNGGSNKLYPQFLGNQIYSVSNILNTQSNVITGAPGYYITGIIVSVHPQSSFAGGGSPQIVFSDSSSGALLTLIIGLPSTPGAVTLPTVLQALQTPGGFFWNNKVSSSSLSVIFNAAFSGGGVCITINYGITSIVN